MITNHGYIDGSWKLKIVSEDLNGIVDLRVFNNTTLAEVIINISKYFNISSGDMKGYGLWCPSKNSWLVKTELTLHRLLLNANTHILVMRRIRKMNIQLPNKEERVFLVDYSQPLIKTIKTVCSDLKYSSPYLFTLIKSCETFNPFNSFKQKHLTTKAGKSPHSQLSRGALNQCPWTPTSGYGSLSIATSLDNFHGSMYSVNDNPMKIATENGVLNTSCNHLASSPRSFKRKTTTHNRTINKETLFYSRSPMEQKIDENSLQRVTIKYMELKTIDAHVDDSLLDVIFEQVKDSILNGDVDVDIKFALIFAALQYQSIICPISDLTGSVETIFMQSVSLEEEIDNILTTLERKLLLSSPSGLEQHNLIPIGTAILLNIQQINPKQVIHHSRRMRFVLDRNEVRMYKEGDSRSVQYLFNIKECKFSFSIGSIVKENQMSLCFFSFRKRCELLVNFFSDTDFITMSSLFIVHSNCWNPNISVFETTQAVVRKVLSILRSNEVSAYNIFNMPRVELKDLIGNKLVKLENSGNYLKEMLQYHCCFKELSKREAKLHYITLFTNVPYFNCSYFYVKVVSPNSAEQNTMVAISPEMFLLFDYSTHTIPISVFPWTMLKMWSTNSETNIINLHFQRLSLCLSTIECSSLCFHELISLYIWYSSCADETSKSDKFIDLLDVINGKYC